MGDSYIIAESLDQKPRHVAISVDEIGSIRWELPEKRWLLIGHVPMYDLGNGVLQNDVILGTTRNIFAKSFSVAAQEIRDLDEARYRDS